MRTSYRGAIVAFALCIAACSSGSEAEPEVSGAPDDVDVTVPSGDAAPAESDGNEAGQSDDGDEPATTDAQADEVPAEPEARYLGGDADYLFDQDELRTFEINLSDDALAELDSSPSAEEYVEGSFTFDGETLESVGVRYKGSVGAFVGCTSGGNPLDPSGPKSCTKLSLKLKINWNGSDAEFYGQRKVQLHSMNLDPTMMRDRLGYFLFAQAGVPAPRSTHARVVVNGEFVGVFALVEQIDGRFTRDRFEDGKGNLYKEVWPIDGRGEFMSNDVLIDALETNEDDDPSAEILASFAQEVVESGAATDAEAARAVLSERTDVETLVAYAVVDRAIRNDDGVFHWYCFSGPCEPHNFFIYEEPESRRVHVIPWDLDNAFANIRGPNPVTYIADDFGETQADCQPFTAGPFPVTQRSAACDPIVAAWALLDTEFDEFDAEFRAGLFSIEQVRPLIELWSAQIAPVVAEAAEAHADAPSVADWELAVQNLLQDIENSNAVDE